MKWKQTTGLDCDSYCFRDPPQRHPLISQVHKEGERESENNGDAVPVGSASVSAFYSPNLALFYVITARKI